MALLVKMPKVRRQRHSRAVASAPRESYNKEQRLRAAFKGYKQKRYTSIRAAARANKVNFGTLRRRLSGLTTKAQDGLKRRLLTGDEEELLVEWIVELTDRYIPAKPTTLGSMAITILRSREPPSFK